MYCGMIVCDPDRALCRLKDRIDRGATACSAGYFRRNRRMP